MSEEIKTPKYEFLQDESVEESPIKRRISKTMEVTEHFNLYDVLSYIAKMDKRIADLNAEIDGIKNMKDAYEKELKLIEETLGVQKLQEEFEKVNAAEVTSDEEKE